ncbi:type II secretion system GspH family protein [Patescibacteria group bacterium]|nr:type II secretion system GspH family protein [Patescibacteria group bacterium]
MKGGFTLIETLVVIAIVAILSTIIIAYSNSGNTRLALFSDRAKISGALERAKNLSLEKWGGYGGGVACGYGVYFSVPTNSYLIYGYRAPDINSCNSSTTLPAYNPSSPNYEVIQSLSLSGGVTFSSVSTSSIYFEPPYLNSNGGAVTLMIGGGNTTSSVEVTSDGGVTSL